MEVDGQRPTAGGLQPSGVYTVGRNSAVLGHHEVGRRESEFTSTLVTHDDNPTNLEGPAQQFCCLGDLTCSDDLAYPG